MAENAQLYTSNVTETLQRDAATIDNIASIVGVSSLAIAAPMAREMNKAEVGDYSGLAALYEPYKTNLVNFQQEISPVTGELVYVPITDEYIAADYAYVQANQISNVTASRIAGELNATARQGTSGSLLKSQLQAR